jgi:cyclophilin family peptidyl-prolyl cis-trans isomerase/protein-disulfide isomerase
MGPQAAAPHKCHGSTCHIAAFAERCAVLLALLLSACAPHPASATATTPPPTRILLPAEAHSPVPPTATIEPAPVLPTTVSLPAASASDWARGSAHAAVTIVEYGDFQSMLCARLALALAELQKMHPDQVRLIYRHFPLLNTHDKASLAGQAAEAAGAQGAFWPMHDLLYARHDEWADLAPQEFTAWLVQAAAELQLDVSRFSDDLAGANYEAQMDAAFELATAAGLPGAPSLFINNAYFQMEPALVTLEATVRLELLSRVQYSTYPPLVIDLQKTYLARFVLEDGEVVARLYTDGAPLAVNSFVFLARQGWFDGLGFYRVIPGYLVETGDPSETGFGGCGYVFDTEIDPQLSFDREGMLAMSSSGPDTNSSQFFITLTALPGYNGTRTIFGEVIAGLDLLHGLQARDPLSNLLDAPEVTIQQVRIEEK